MRITLGLANVGFDQVSNVLASAKQANVDLLVFPENFCLEPEGSGGPCVQCMAQIACELGAWVVYAGREDNRGTNTPYNTAVVIDNTGVVRARYRKCHLYDAHGEYESSRMAAGSELLHPIQTPFGTLGLGICYDLRFPEVARFAAVRGCELMLFPAAWHDGQQKLEHWKTLLRARAIENEMFVAGVCMAGKRYVSESYVVDPLGRMCASGSQQLVCCTIDMADVAKARWAMPVLEHRRPELYG